MDYVLPTDLLNDAIQTTSRKASLSVRDLLIRSFLAGGLLAYATSFVFIVLAQNIDPSVGAILLLAGTLFYAGLFYLAFTHCGTSSGSALGDLVNTAAQKKTLGYMALGLRGW